MKSRSLQVFPCPHPVTCTSSVCMCMTQRRVCYTRNILSYLCSVPFFLTVCLRAHTHSKRHTILLYICGMVCLIASPLICICLLFLIARDTSFHINKYSTTYRVYLSKLNCSIKVCVYLERDCQVGLQHYYMHLWFFDL